MELKLLNHQDTTGEEIARDLNSGKYSEFKVAVAYSRNSGIGRIYNELNSFANQGGITSVIAGIDQRNTSYQALVNLKTFAKDNLFIHHDKNFDVTFHPKVYLFGNKNIEKVIIGSSNLTAGGFYLNYEANIGITLDTSNRSKIFQKSITEYWYGLLNDKNTKRCEQNLLDNLLDSGAIIDENQQRPFKDVIQRISNDLPFSNRKKIQTLPHIATETIVDAPDIKETFAMTLSGFDVSNRSQDPVILIPLMALRSKPIFWNFPSLYTDSGAGYPQLYATAIIHHDGNTFRDQHIRIYYYDRKKEFRLQCERIKRNGKQGDIIVIHRNPKKPLEYKIELKRLNSKDYNSLIPKLTNKASNQKFFNYF